ncbi:MAG TPA: hypothetical protein VMT66_00010 [Steroidobacteraceae bacterium]|nr:hypothetical protein [Steroidobacteraceae bacterium]
MLKSYQYWILMAVTAASLLLVVLDARLVMSNRVLRTEVDSRGKYIQQSIQLQGLYQEVIKALADLAVRNKDDELRDLLSRQGISVTVTPPAPSGARQPQAPRQP